MIYKTRNWLTSFPFSTPKIRYEAQAAAHFSRVIDVLLNLREASTRAAPELDGSAKHPDRIQFERATRGEESTTTAPRRSTAVTRLER